LSFDKPPFDKFKKPGFGKSFGKAPFPRRHSDDDRSSERKPFERKSFERDSSERKPFERRPFERDSSERKPFERKPFERGSFEKKPFERKSFDRKPFEKKPFERRSFDRRSEDTPESGRPFFRPDQPLKVSEESNHRMIRSERPEYASREKAAFAVQSQAIETLAQVMNQHNLSEIEYKEGPIHIRLSKKQEGGVFVPHSSAAEVSASAPVGSPSLEAEASAPEGTSLKSPMVGTVYLASKPGEAPFVKVGDAVQEGQVVLIVEAMKVMNTLKAPVSGSVKSILIKDGEPVEYGQDLLYIG
jgi:acetyl-CoA carboxylase biotin carboxyl carrier protein